MLTTNSSTDWTNFMTDEDKQEFIKSPEFKDWLIGALSDPKNPVTITFTKKDGTSRRMRCTRSPEQIPTEHHPKTESNETGSNIRAYDLDIGEWRSFIIENVTRLEYTF